ncbi:MAG: zinc ribbon domain-containing protein [Desulfobacteraceae bacterium]|uniref:Zinc ribbon domain-containing protein n=1 Tax=Candidatus Desulfacyla euxinica TaxID=2841693 RepID=A0A8J6T4F3_9DELT|nr:zinc ribbon domain-containing protein [Candidatus Desulfacyla euxinica]MBL6977424.1 zinc ribbon domain-containing protein [Desulfobacteraceae bacterium]MBL7216526.1 zinc ribbon domain-containing protein [Desulfobacteraceae bacterium]
MPIYEFKCKKCDNTFESLCFRNTGEDKGPCPSCGSEESEKQLSIFSSVSSDSGPCMDMGSCSDAPSCASQGGFS